MTLTDSLVANCFTSSHACCGVHWRCDFSTSSRYILSISDALCSMICCTASITKTLSIRALRAVGDELTGRRLPSFHPARKKFKIGQPAT